MVRKHTLFGILFVLSNLGSGCASFKPVVIAPVYEPPSSSLTIIPVEGRPKSVLLKIQWIGTESFTHLVLYRVVPDKEPIALHTLQFSPQIQEQLRTGVVLSDPTVELGSNTYAAVLMRGDNAVDVAELVFDWNEAAPPPNVSYALIHHQVVLKWDSPRTYGAVVFRRDLLTEQGLVRIADLQPSHHGFFVDANVLPEGVYAYRVALMETPTVNGGPATFPRFGSPSEELYVTVDQTMTDSPAEPNPTEETP